MKKFMSLLLSVLLLLSLVPMTVAATGEDWNSFVYSQDGPVFSFEATEFTGDSTGYKFYAAAYDNAGKLLAVKSSNATVSGDTLSANVDFEPGNTEANVNIASVKTMLWNGITPVVRAGEFTITAPTATAGTDTYAMTNGFYEPISATDDYAYCFYLGDGTNEDYSYRNTSDGTGKGYDNDLSTALGFDGIQSYSRMDFVKLSAASEIDRVVTWTYDNPSSVPNPRQTGTEYYLVNLDAELNSSSASSAIKAVWDGMTTSAASTNYYYLGTLASEARFVTDDDARTVMDVNSANTYQYMAAKKDNRVGVSGKTVELQAYKNKVQQDVVDAFSVTADYNGLVYEQDGPVFSVEAGEFTANTNALKLVATAYDGANGTGNVVTTVSEPITVTAGEEIELTKSVDFEKDTAEADVSIASVVVKVTDSTGTMAVLPASTFNVTPQTIADGVYNNFTNGFYKPVIGNASVTASVKLYRWNNSVYDAEWSDPNIINNILDGNHQNTATTATKQFQQVITLSAASKIDRVVAYTNRYDGTCYYLANTVNLTSSDAKSAHDDLFRGQSTSTLTYLGSNVAGGIKADVSINSTNMRRVMFDTDGGNYQYIMVDHPTTTNSATGTSSATRVYDIQAYQKVTQTNVLEAVTTSVKWDSVTFSQDGPAFTLNGTGFETNADALYFTATAYNSSNVKIDEVEAAIDVDGTISETVSFEGGNKPAEADVTIAKVTTVIKDAYDVVYATADFAVTPQSVENNVYNNFTNGFYKPVIGNDGVTASAQAYYKWIDGGYAGTGADANLADHNFTTYGSLNQSSGTQTSGQVFTWQKIVTLSAAAKVDRVVAYSTAGSNAYYLAKTIDVSSSGRGTHDDKFLGTATTDEDLYYLGDNSGITATSGVYRLVANTDGDAYTYLIMHAPASGGGNTRLADIQGYVKVTATQTIASNK